MGCLYSSTSSHLTFTIPPFRTLVKLGLGKWVLSNSQIIITNWKMEVLTIWSATDKSGDALDCFDRLPSFQMAITVIAIMMTEKKKLYTKMNDGWSQYFLFTSLLHCTINPIVHKFHRITALRSCKIYGKCSWWCSKDVKTEDWDHKYSPWYLNGDECNFWKIVKKSGMNIWS